ncbi:MAG: hypothetical protein ACI9JN_000987 [Bacteroidia bacterium]
MEIVSKHNSIDDMVVHQSLSELERKALIANFAHENATSDQSRTAKEILEQAKRKNAWIRCDCLTEQAALLFPRLTHSGVYTLVRPCPVRQIPHSDSCAFYLSESDSMAGQGDTQSVQTNYCLLAVDKPKSEKSTSSRPTSQSTDKKLSTLSTIFLRLLAEADTFRLSNHHYPSFNQIAINLKKVASTQPLWVGSSLKLSTVLLTNIKKRVPFFFHMRNQDGFDQAHRKQGFMLVQVKIVSGKTLVCHDNTALEITGSIDCHGAKDADSYLALILCGESVEGNGYFVNYRASLISVYSEKIPFITTSPEHHLLIKRLIAWRQYWRNKNYDFELHYPLSIGSEMPLKPSILVSDTETGKRLSISTDIHCDEFHFEPEQPVKDFNIAVSKELWASE